MALQKNDVEIIRLLRRNSREKLTSIAEKTGMPVTTVFDRMNKFEKMGLQHITLIDFNDVGMFSRNKTVIKVNQENKKALEEHLHQCKNINNMYAINNGFDFLIETIFPTKTEFKAFIDEIKNNYKIQEMQSFEIIKDHKRESFEL